MKPLIFIALLMLTGLATAAENSELLMKWTTDRKSATFNIQNLGEKSESFSVFFSEDASSTITVPAHKAVVLLIEVNEINNKAVSRINAHVKMDGKTAVTLREIFALDESSQLDMLVAGGTQPLPLRYKERFVLVNYYNQNGNRGIHLEESGKAIVTENSVKTSLPVVSLWMEMPK